MSIYTDIPVCNKPYIVFLKVSLFDLRFTMAYKITKINQINGELIMNRKSHNEMYLQSLKERNGFRARYVSELVTYSKIIDGIINLIESPCGTGKTTFLLMK